MSTAKTIANPSNVEHLPCLLNSRIGNDRFHLHRRLGSGGSGVVYLATDLRATGRSQVAVKCLAHKSREQRRKNLHEVSLHRRAARLPGVVDLYDTLEEHGLLFLILQYCDSGDLFSLITEDSVFIGRDDLIKRAFVQLLETVRGLHSMGIYHRDIKPENILSTHKGTRLLIADFGLATEHIKSSTFGCGSRFYMTPECLAGYYFASPTAYSTRAADIWALGILLINLITSRSPWECAIPTDHSFEQYIRNPAWLRQLLPLSQSAFSFVNRIFFKHGNGITHEELMDRFHRIDTFSMTDEEIPFATKTSKALAHQQSQVDSLMVDIFSDDSYSDADRTLVDDSSLDDDRIKVTKFPDDVLMSIGALTCDDDADESDDLSRSSSDSEILITPDNGPTNPSESVPHFTHLTDMENIVQDSVTINAELRPLKKQVSFV